LIFLVIRGCRQHQSATRAAALTFITVFGLVPFLAVALSVMSGLADLRIHEDKVLDFLVEQLPRISSGRTSSAAPTSAPAAGTEDYRRAVRDKIKGWIGKVQYGRIGALALIFCVLIFFQLLSSVESAFNNIWGVKRQRSFLQRLRAYWMLLIVPVLIAGYAATAASVRAGLADSAVMSRIFRLVSELGFMWLAFVSLYWLLPNTRVRFSAAGAAALFSAILLELLKQSTILVTWLFGYRADSLAEIYGTSVAIIPLFLFVVFVLWLIALFGAELSYAAQNLRAYARDRRALGLNQRSRETLGLRLLLEVAARFDRGEPAPSTAGLSDQFDVSLALVRDMLGLFERGELIRSYGQGAEATWQATRPLERITAAEAMTCMRRAGGEELSLPEAEPLDKTFAGLVSEWEERSAAALDRATLRDVLNRARKEGAPDQLG